jgi:hypothetical protein
MEVSVKYDTAFGVILDNNLLRPALSSRMLHSVGAGFGLDGVNDGSVGSGSA